MVEREFNPSEPELMDRPQELSQSLEMALRNLEGLNRHFGGHRALRWFFRGRLVRGHDYDVLDLATGGGDNPRMLVRRYRGTGIGTTFHAVDFQAPTLELAQRWSQGYPEINYIEADVLEFEPGRKFDYVFCALALHHFSAEDAVRVLSKAKSLARRGVLVVDLERSRLSAVCVWLVTAVLYRDEMTRSDGRESVRRAFSIAELGDLARSAGWKNFGQRRFAPARQAIWMDLDD